MISNDRGSLKYIKTGMVEKAPIVKEYNRAGSVFGVRGIRLLRLFTTIATIGITYSTGCHILGAGFYCLFYVPFDESRGDNVFSPVSVNGVG